MRVDSYEKIFMALGVLVLIGGLVAIGISVVYFGIHVPSPGGRLAPADVRATEPFDEPGVYETGDGEYEVIMIASTWQFTPNEVRVPAGSEVTFRLTSTDVVHGFLIEKTAVNLMAIPGQVGEVTATFDEPGEHLFLCHEYCGSGHHVMDGRVVVE